MAENMAQGSDPLEDPGLLNELASPQTLWPLRSNLLALKFLKGRGLKKEDADQLDSLINLVSSYIRFDTSIRVFLGGEEYTKLATLLDLGAFWVISFQDLLSKEDVNLRKVLVGVLSEALVVAGSVQYFRQSSDMLEKEIFLAVSDLYDILWEIALFRSGRDVFVKKGVEDTKNLRDGLDELAKILTDRKRPPAERIAVIHMIYRGLLKDKVRSVAGILSKA